MTLINCYATDIEVAELLGIDDFDDADRIDGAIQAASRQIDDHCGRGGPDGHGFWVDETVTTRQFYAVDGECVEVTDISTVNGLVVKLDDAGDGTYGTTLTVGTDFILAPVNAAVAYPVRPYSEIILMSGYRVPQGRRPGMQVTAKFGWPTVPDSVATACRIQAKNIYKASSGTLSGFQLAGIEGVVTRIPALDGVAVALLESVRKVSV